MGMRKILALFTAAVMLLTLQGCLFAAKEAPAQEGGSAAVALKEDKTLDELVEQISTELEFPMPGELGAAVTELLGLKKDDFRDYAGILSMDAGKADTALIIKAAPGKERKVKEALEARLDDQRGGLEKVQPAEHEKAKAGQVLERGSYLCLIIAGTTEFPPEEAMEKARTILNSYFTPSPEEAAQ